MRLNVSWVRNSVVRSSAAGMRAVPSATEAPKPASSASTSASVVSSPKDTPTVVSSIARTRYPASASFATTSGAPATFTATVSKNSACLTFRPAASSDAAKSAARWCTARAMSFNPSGPW